MSRRERLERKLALRREWAEKREQRGNAAISQSLDMVSIIPMGQPILIGHHSEKRHRALLARSDNAMRRGCESLDMAKHHDAKASGIEAQLETSIFSDDENAIDQLKARIAELEKDRDENKRLNAWWRKHGTMRGCPGISEEAAAKIEADIARRSSFARQPAPAYSLTNLGANIRRLKQRIEEITRRNARTEAAQNAGGVVIEGSGDYIRVTFAEKPEREILDALKAAGFRWGGGSWTGLRSKLPPCAQPAEECDKAEPTATQDEE